MVLKSDKEKVKTLLSETIRLLCKNGLHFKTEFSVEALVGITLDREEEFFLSIKEIVKTDIPPPKPKPDVVRTPKEIRRSSVKEVKGEPRDMSPCPRKRPAETVTNNGSASELPNLSLGDMQESEPTFWGSVTERDDGGGQVVKKKRTDPNDDDSNSNVITIKGEPGSDSDNDIECVGDSSDRDNTLDQSTMGDMSGSFMYGTPTSEQNMLGNMTTNMGQSWDQMPQFPMPGPSGMAQGGDVSQDGQQQQDAAARDSTATPAMPPAMPPAIPPVMPPAMSPATPAMLPAPPAASPATDTPGTPTQSSPVSTNRGRPMSEAKMQRMQNLQNDPYYIPRLMRRIMLTKGREVTPKQVYWNFSYRDRPSVALIHQVMKELASRGMGQYGKNERKTTFCKTDPWSLGNTLQSYGIEMHKYQKQFYAVDKQNETF